MQDKHFIDDYVLILAEQSRILKTIYPNQVSCLFSMFDRDEWIKSIPNTNPFPESKRNKKRNKDERGNLSRRLELKAERNEREEKRKEKMEDRMEDRREEKSDEGKEKDKLFASLLLEQCNIPIVECIVRDKLSVIKRARLERKEEQKKQKSKRLERRKIINREYNILNSGQEGALRLLSKDGNLLGRLKQENMTFSAQITAVRQNPSSVRYIKHGYEDSYVSAVSRKGNVIRFIDSWNLTDYIRYEAVKQNGLAIRFIDPKFRDLDIIETAICSNKRAINYVNQTYDLWTHLIKICKQDVLEYMNEEFRTEEIYSLYIEHNPYFCFYSIPVEKRTPNLCLYAVKKAGISIQYMSDDEKTPFICAEAFKEDFTCIKFIPYDIQTREMCLKAVKSAGVLIRYVKDELQKDQEIIKAAVRQNPKAIIYIKEQPSELCIEIIKDIKNDYNLFLHFCDPSYPVCLEAVKRNWRLLKSVKDKYHTDELHIEAIKQDKIVLTFIPKEHQSIKICTEAFNIYGAAILKYIKNPEWKYKQE